MIKRILLLVLFALVFGPGSMAVAQTTQVYPERPIRLIVPFGAGGITDIVARQVGKELGDVLGQSVVIENRPGAGGVIAARLAVQAKPDGYSVFMGTVGTQVVLPLLTENHDYDPEVDLLPVGMVSGSPYVLAIRSTLGVKSFAEFVSYAKAHPGELNFGSAGNATSPHLGLELLKLTSGLDIVHIPYKSGSEAVNAALGEQVDIVLDASSVIMPHVASGKLRALLVAAPERLVSAPGVPSNVEAGAALQISSWNAFFVPAGTPSEIVSKLNSALQKTLASKGLQERMAAQGTELYTGTMDEFHQFMSAERAKWKKTIEHASIRMG